MLKEWNVKNRIEKSSFFNEISLRIERDKTPTERGKNQTPQTKTIKRVSEKTTKNSEQRGR